MTQSASEWLLSVGPLVKRLNRESLGDASDERRLPIPNCPGYEASEDGRIYSNHSERFLLGRSVDRYGYFYVTVWLDGKAAKRRVHRLVCEAWHGPCPEGLECAHLDGDCANNRADNLRWVTHRENVGHMILHGTINRDVSAAVAASVKRDRSGSRNPNARFSDDDVAEIKRLVEFGWSMRRVGALFGVNPGTISKISRRHVAERPQPAARFSRSGIAIAEHLRDDGGDSNPLSRNS